MDSIAVDVRGFDGGQGAEALQFDRRIHLQLHLFESRQLGEQLGHVPFADRPTLVQEDHTVADPLGEVHIVGGQEHRGAGQAE